jgi:hypothetical protein
MQVNHGQYGYFLNHWIGVIDGSFDLFDDVILLRNPGSIGKFNGSALPSTHVRSAQIEICSRALDEPAGLGRDDRRILLLHHRLKLFFRGVQ